MRNSIEFLFGGKGLLIALFTVFTLTSYGQQFENTVQRKGFVIGLGVGAGVISFADSDAENPFDDAQGGISFPNLKIGWMLNEVAYPQPLKVQFPYFFSAVFHKAAKIGIWAYSV